MSKKVDLSKKHSVQGVEVDERDEMTQLDYVDACMTSLGQCLNLLDPDGTFEGMPSEEVLTKLMQAVREQYRKLSSAILALREEEPILGFAEQHDGKLEELAKEQAE